MTIVLAVAAPDGIVLAADSRSTMLDGTGRYRVASDTAEKVFSVCDKYGVLTYGDAFIGAQTIAGVMAEYGAHIKDSHPAGIVEFAADIGKFFVQRYGEAYQQSTGADLPATADPTLGLVVAGYDTHGVGHVYEIHIPDGKVLAGVQMSTVARSVWWRGQTDVINRMVRGVDWDGVADLPTPIPDPVRTDLEGLAYALQHPLTLQDAIDFATFLAQTTIDMQRFSDGLVSGPGAVPGCGGPVNVLTVTRPGIQWITRPELRARKSAGAAEGSA